MSLELPRLSHAAFIADLSPRERSLWRIALTLVAGLLGGLVVGLIGGLLALLAIVVATGGLKGGLQSLLQGVNSLVSEGGATVRGALGLLSMAAATNVPLAATFIVIAAMIAGRKVSRYVTTAPKIRWRLLLAGLLLSFLIIGPGLCLAQSLDPHAPPAPMLNLAKDWPTRIGYAIACFLLLIPAAAAEEILFRGWLLRQSAMVTRNPWFLMALNGVLFSAVHGIGAPSELAPDPFLTRALMGAGFTYMTLRLGGIEFSTGAHAANNILIVLFVEPLTLKPAASSGVSIDSLAQDLFLLVSYVLMAEAVARWPLLRRWSGADQVPDLTANVAAEHFS